MTAVLEELGIPDLIGGPLASTLHGMIRTTQDFGIITEVRPENIQPSILSLQDEFFIDGEMIADGIQRNSSFNILHRDTMFGELDLEYLEAGAKNLIIADTFERAFEQSR